MICPKCKNEYRPGIYQCTECECDLVESLEQIEGKEEKMLPLTFAKEYEPLKALKEFLDKNNVSGTDIRVNIEEQVYELLVPEKEFETAQNYADLLMKSIREKQAKEMPREEVPERKAPVSYRDNDARAAENKSSAVVLLVVGIVGMAVIIACLTGIIPVNLSQTSKYMTYGTMSALFLIFIIMGLISMKSYRVFAKKAASDNSVKESMKKWVEENLKKEEIDAEAFAYGENTTDEEKYFRRYEVLKRRIGRQFMNLDESFMESFIEEVYAKMYD